MWIESGGSWAASWRATAPMPAAGRQFSPVARQRMTNSNSRDVTRSSRSKKMPPRKGRKNLSTMASEKPSACGGPHALAHSWLAPSDRAQEDSMMAQLPTEGSRDRNSVQHAAVHLRDAHMGVTHQS